MSEVKINGKNIYYEVHGDQGDFIVMLNGLMMSTNSWLPLIQTVKENFRVVLIDMHDQGRSEKMEHSYKHDVQVEAVKGVLDHLNIEKANFCGTSYGGTIALQIALTYPEKCNKLMVFNTLAYADKFLTDVGKLWEKAAASYDPDKFYDEFAPYIYAPWYYEKFHDSIYERKELFRSFFTPEYCDAFIRLSNSTQGYDIRERLSEISTPVLVVGSDEDYLTPMKQQYFLKNNLPNSEFVIIPDSGHGAVYEKSLLIVTLMMGWFRDITVIPVFKEGE
ncbi:MAG: alpha/beta hydrolase [Clostridia bacterium]|nr:alpha/beta hydrolase [Clostridia bacterium]